MLATIVFLGPLRSTHFPNTAADSPSSASAIEYATPTSASALAPTQKIPLILSSC
jgi:hypothetical protein